MKSLTGVYLKSDIKEEESNGTTLYPFMLIFPDKKRLYFLKSNEDKNMWVNAIKQAIGHANILTYYEVGEVLGKGKYGTVRQARHLLSDRECAVKLVKKKDLDIKELELLRREIEVLKVCQHPNIIKFYDVFENEHYIYIVMELLRGGDLFRYLQKQSFVISEERAREISH
jgi:serine/threonine protein kinase